MFERDTLSIDLQRTLYSLLFTTGLNLRRLPHQPIRLGCDYLAAQVHATRLNQGRAITSEYLDWLAAMLVAFDHLIQQAWVAEQDDEPLPALDRSELPECILEVLDQPQAPKTPAGGANDNATVLISFGEYVTEQAGLRASVDRACQFQEGIEQALRDRNPQAVRTQLFRLHRVGRHLSWLVSSFLSLGLVVFLIARLLTG